MRARRSALRLLASAAGLALALLGLELGVRAVAPQPLGAQEAAPLQRGMLTQPGEHRVATPEYDLMVHVNARGFVDREWGPKTRPRIVLVGDSFVQAAQVPMDAGLGRRLEAELGGVADVLSVGIPGAGTATAYDALDAYVFPLEPDVVVLGFLVANDVLNNHALLDTHADKPFYRLERGELVRTDPLASAAPLPWLWTRSDAFRLVARAWAARRESAGRIEAGEGGVPLDYLVYGSEADPRWGEAWTITDALVGAMARRCAEHRVGFGTLLFPDSVQATRAGRARVNGRWPVMASWHPESAQARALDLASAHGPALDLLPALRAADGPVPLYFLADGHWTAAGHAVAATAAAPFVRELLAVELLQSAGGR